MSYPDYIVDNLEKRLNASLDREKKLRKALEFYACEMNYSTDDYHGISGEMINRCVLYKDLEERNDVYSYAGKLARQTLKELYETET